VPFFFATERNMVADKLFVASLGDLHFGKTSRGSLQPLLERIADEADILALCGDLTNHGFEEEGQLLAQELSASLNIPVVAVLGNHDHESGQGHGIAEALTKIGVHILEGDACEVRGIGFAGVKGFGGGFGQRMLSPFGEEGVKRFVQEALAESLKLEAALARLRTPHRFALLHYSPIVATIDGEPLEIFPFLGCSRLEEPLNRYPLDAVFHGHAHHGKPTGKTQSGVPVYNVSYPLMMHLNPERPFHLQEVAAAHSEPLQRMA
jgi:Icc-related predicted phosphoesterase